MKWALPLSAGVVVLLAVIGLELRNAREPLVAPALPPSLSVAATTPGSGPASATAMAQEVNAILSRPLFSVDRRPEAGVTTSDEAELPRLTGLMVSPTGRVALFARSHVGNVQAIAEGGRIGPYVVESIQPTGVIVLGPRGRQVIRPSFPSEHQKLK